MYSKEGHEQLGTISSSSPSQRVEKEARVERLTSVYQQAKRDYENVAGADSAAKLDAARFLRDTAENTIVYFRRIREDTGNYVSTELMRDLEQAFMSASASVVSLNGGRKRKFDRVGNMPPADTPHQSGGMARAAKTVVRDGGRGSAGGYVSCTSLERARQCYPINPAERDISTDFGPGRGRGRQRPFGYNRPVDSYQPAGPNEYNEIRSHRRESASNILSSEDVYRMHGHYGSWKDELDFRRDAQMKGAYECRYQYGH